MAEIEIKINKLLENLKNKKVGVFCDDSNLYHSYIKYRWRIDIKRFREFLEAHCDLQFINYYIAVPDKSDAVYFGTQKFLKNIKPYVTVKEKRLKYTPMAGKFMKKGDVDVEIVLGVVREIDDLDIVIIVSGDSDFYELKNYIVKDKGKNIIFWAFEKNMAWELKYCWHLYLDDYKKEIELNLERKPPGFTPG
ncbi:NYN domain-containing protein [Patescibacteria group bacterium]|nr:NYN domain-containing protein [Patescibacteria group bacterium]MBU4162415.1 NYN domain-containing protein [Patescibacteria group bacterium]